MTPKQELFIVEYLMDRNATRAAMVAGYSAKSARRIGTRLSTDVHIRSAIAEKQREHLAKANLTEPVMADDAHVVKVAKAEVTAARTIEEMACVGFSNIKRLFDGDTMKPISQWTDEEAAMVASVEVIIKNAAAGDGHTDTIHKIKMWDKMRGLEFLGKYLGILREHLDVTVSVELLDRLDTWKQRHLHAGE